MSKEEDYRRILNKKLEVYEVRKPEVNAERYATKEKCINWAIEKLNEDIMPCGTIADLPEGFMLFGSSSCWEAFRLCVLMRDDDKCRICGKPAREVHHIRPRYLKGKDHPRNLIALCEKCHDDVHLMIEEGIEKVLGESIGHGNLHIKYRLGQKTFGDFDEKQ